MSIVKWQIPIIGKLANNRPIIGAPLVALLRLINDHRTTAGRGCYSQ